MIAQGVSALSLATIVFGAVGTAGMALGSARAEGTDPSWLTAGDGHIVVSDLTPGCAVTVSGSGYQATARVGSTGVSVLEAQLPNGLELQARTSGPDCPPDAASAVVLNEGAGESERMERTAPETALGVIAGLGAVGVGTSLVVAARRKKP